jgi:hypothetical protein
MYLYADRPQRRMQQIVTDLFGMMWGLGAVAVGIAVRGWVRDRTEPAMFVESTAASLADALAEAADRIADVPVVGDELAAALRRAADSAAGLSTSGESMAGSIERIGDLFGLFVIVVGVGAAASVWLRPRVHWYHEASDARAVLRQPDRDEVLSAQALAGVIQQPGAGRLVAGWRAGEPSAVRALARAELDRLGMAYPRDLSPGLDPARQSPAGQGASTGRSAS